MQWYYAVSSERHGPVDTITFNRLVTQGTIVPDTLVWRTGMPEWQPWSVVAPTVTNMISSEEAHRLPADEAAANAPWPDEETVSHDVSADMPMEELWPRIQAQGFHTTIGSCLSRAWTNLKSSYWEAVGTTLLFALLAVGSQMFPLVGMVATFVVVPQLTAGIWWYFIRRSRGEAVSISDLFAGFSRGFVQFVLLALFQFMLLLPLELAARHLGLAPGAEMPALNPVMIIPFLVYTLITIYVITRWQFAHALVIDRGYSALDAIKLSWRIVGLRFWTIFGLGLVLGCLIMLGLMAFIVGAVLIAPMLFAAMAEAYEDAIGPTR